MKTLRQGRYQVKQPRDEEEDKLWVNNTEIRDNTIKEGNKKVV